LIQNKLGDYVQYIVFIRFYRKHFNMEL